jgi:enoyl-CoA hydratase
VPSSTTLDALIGDSTESLVSVNDGGIRILIFNRPAVRNALSYDLRQAYARAIEQIESDDTIRVAILAGAGGHFCSGLDVKDHRANPGRPMFRPHPGEVTRAMKKPILAAVDGYCLTGGLELALSCSFIIATDLARFADTHAKIGGFPSWGLSALLPRAVGVRRARQMLMTGEMINADLALEWGMINEVVSPSALLGRCLELAHAIQRANQDSIAAQLSLIAMNDGEPLRSALLAEEEARQSRDNHSS